MSCVFGVVVVVVIEKKNLLLKKKKRFHAPGVCLQMRRRDLAKHTKICFREQSVRWQRIWHRICNHASPEGQ